MAEIPVVAPRGLLSRRHNDILGGISVRPMGTRFATQDPDEEIFILVRKAAITNIGWISSIAFSAIIPPVAFVILNGLGVNLNEIMGIQNQVIFVFVYYSILFTYGLLKFNEWYYNVFIVTNKRVLDYHFKVLVGKQVAEADLRNIQDVSQSVIGFLPSFFNYGNLLIQTAGQKNKFRIKSVPQPTWLRDVLVDLSKLTSQSEP